MYGHKYKLRPPSEEGQSLVEFALVLTFVIIPFTLVFIEASVLLYEYVALTNAAREGARAGSIYIYIGDPGTTTTLADAGRNNAVASTVQGTIGPLIPTPTDCNATANETVCKISYGSSGAPGFTDPLRSSAPLTVTLTYTHPLLFGALGNAVSLQAQASMEIEPSSVITASP